jgi:hypothetical protein
VNELDAIQYLIETINPKKVVRPPEEVHIEGGDVMLWNNYIFVGTYKGTIKDTLLHEPIYKVCSTSGFISK